MDIIYMVQRIIVLHVLQVYMSKGQFRGIRSESSGSSIALWHGSYVV